MFPPPTTTATSTPRSWTRFTVRAIEWMRSASTPYSSGPISASPESFSSTRRKAGLPFAAPGSDTIEIYPGTGLGGLFADAKAREPADNHVLTRLRRDVGAQLLDRPPLVPVGVHVLLLEQHDLLEPLPHAPLGDLLADLGWLALVGLLLEQRHLTSARILGDIVGRHVRRRCRRDVDGDLAGEVDELLVARDEV